MLPCVAKGGRRRLPGITILLRFLAAISSVPVPAATLQLSCVKSGTGLQRLVSRCKIGDTPFAVRHGGTPDKKLMPGKKSRNRENV